MKVLIVHNRYRSAEPSGEDRVVDREAAALESVGHHVGRYERRNDDIANFSKLQSAAIPASVVWNPIAGHAFAKALDESRPDVVHVHNLFPLLSPSVLQACERRHVPVVATFHNYRQLCANGTFFRSGSVCYDCVNHNRWSGVRHGCYRDSHVASAPIALANLVQRPTWRTTPSAYIFISDSQRKLFSSLDLPQSRCFVKWHFVQPIEVTKQTDNLVVFTGRLSEAKGLRLLMRAWERFEGGPDHQDMRLAIAGTGELLDEVRSWANYQSSVDVLGLLNRDECAKLVGRARAAVVPSAWPEPFGLVVAEAKSSGVPPIAPSHGSFPELIANGEDGILFPPGDADALAAILRQVANSPSLFEQLGRSARESSLTQFDPAEKLAQLESIYAFACEHPTWREPGDVASLGTGADKSLSM